MVSLERISVMLEALLWPQVAGCAVVWIVAGFAWAWKYWRVEGGRELRIIDDDCRRLALECGELEARLRGVSVGVDHAVVSAKSVSVIVQPERDEARARGRVVDAGEADRALLREMAEGRRRVEKLAAVVRRAGGKIGLVEASFDQVRMTFGEIRSGLGRLGGRVTEASRLRLEMARRCDPGHSGMAAGVRHLEQICGRAAADYSYDLGFFQACDEGLGRAGEAVVELRGRIEEAARRLEAVVGWLDGASAAGLATVPELARRIGALDDELVDLCGAVGVCGGLIDALGAELGRLVDQLEGFVDCSSRAREFLASWTVEPVGSGADPEGRFSSPVAASLLELEGVVDGMLGDYLEVARAAAGVTDLVASRESMLAGVREQLEEGRAGLVASGLPWRGESFGPGLPGGCG